MLRLLLSPRWIAWHVLTLGAMATCGFLAVWQWHRAGSAMGSALNVGYGLQWPLFALFFAFFWWRFLQMEVRALAERNGTDAEPAPEQAAEPAVEATDAAADSPEVERAAPIGDAAIPRARTEQTGPADDRPSPFGPRPVGVGVSRLSDPQLRAYNDELAKLAARNQEA